MRMDAKRVEYLRKLSTATGALFLNSIARRRCAVFLVLVNNSRTTAFARAYAHGHFCTELGARKRLFGQTGSLLEYKA